MRKADTLCALFLIALAALVMGEGLRLGVSWGTDGPRAGFFPFWLGAGLVVSSLIVLGQIWAARGATRKPFVERGKIAPVMKVLIPAVGMGDWPFRPVIPSWPLTPAPSDRPPGSSRPAPSRLERVRPQPR